jgi:gliding motility-associated-like protein
VKKDFLRFEFLKLAFQSLSKSFTTFFQLFVCTFILLNFFNQAKAQVVIPRDGFPYCEPFTKSTFRQNTILGGSPVVPTLTAATGEDPENFGFLRLTNNNTDRRGYVFVDLPFSSAYGLKFSFEYFMYGGTGADGISVFLFDGSISAGQFQIGGWGGSLGYAPINAQDITDQFGNPSPIVLPGLKGGYLGLGLDAWHNWGNNMEGRFGGFDNPNAPPVNLSYTITKQFAQSIAVRGPESSNYKFIAGKRVLHGPENEPIPTTLPLPLSAYLYPNVADIGRRFSLASSVKVVDCAYDGYRKVFVNLKPLGAGYLLSVDMLVTENGSQRIEPIIIDEPYNFPAPPNLKIGFAASTGGDTNFHEIRNVTVEVSDYTFIPIPEIRVQAAEVCVGDENLFEFEVDLESENSFVRCVQLFTTDPGVPDNSPPTGGDPAATNCGLSGVCIEKCDPENNSVTIPGKGTFTVVLDENVDLDDVEDRIKAAVNFVPVAGFVGEAQIFYQVIDNYGLTSFAKTITVTSNPYPKELDNGDLEYPTCDGQSNGLIFDVLVGDLVPGFDYEWFWQPTTGPEVSLGKVGANVVYDAANQQALFSIDNINIGVYTLQVWNPSDGGGCYLEIPITVDQELGTPVNLTSEDEVICEFQPVTFTPFIDGMSPGLQADFKWYQNADRSEPLLNNTTVTLGGSPVQVEVNQGILTLTGLPANGATTQTYEFFVEVAPQVNPGAPNFCPFLGEVISSATVTVHPGIKFTSSFVPDWCREGIGAVNVNADGGNGSKTYTLLDQSGQNILFQNSNGQFLGLLPGAYQVEVTSQSPTCIETVEVVVPGPEIDLGIMEISRVSPSCELDNGQFTFQLSGGNGPYNIGNITLQGDPSANISYDNATDSYTVGGLAPNTNYKLEFLDARSCFTDLSFTLDEISKPVFLVNIPAPICESDVSYFLDVSYDFFEIQNTAVPVFNWYQQETGGSPISNGTGPSGLNYNYDSQSGDLLISNLVGGTYTLYLELSGPDACNLPRQRVDFEFFETPVLQISSSENISCFGGNDGSITAAVSNGNISDFEFKIDGVTDFQSQPIFNVGLQAGTYTIIAQNINTGCQNTVDVTLDEPAALALSNLGTENTFCGLNNGVVTFEITGGTPSYTISLDGNPVTGQNLTASGANVNISDLTAGDYQVIIKDAEGCELIQDFTIVADPFAEFSAIGAIICESDPNTGTPNTAILSPEIIEIASSTPIFQWYYLSSSGNEVAVNSGDVVFGGSSSIDVNGNLSLTGVEASASPYIFLLDVTGDKVCPESKRQVELVVNPLPDPEFTTVPPSCFSGGDGEITVSNGHSTDFVYELLATGESNNSGTFSSLAAGNYSIRVTNSITSCFEILDVELDQPDALELINADFDNPTCGESNGKLSFEIIGGTPDYQIQLNGNLLSIYNSVQTGQSFEVLDLAPGDYDIEITDTNGCVLTAPNLFTLVNDDGVVVDMNPLDEIICVGGDAILLPSYSTSLPVVPTLKWYKDATLTQSITNGTDANGVGYQLNPANGELTIQGLQVGDFTYYVEISGPGICSKIESATVEVIPQITATIVTEDIVCFGDTKGFIEVTPTGGNGVFEISLNGSTFTNQTSYPDLAAGSYTVSIRNDVGCLTEIDVNILGPSEPITINDPTIIRAACGLDNGSIEDLVISGGWGGYNVEWRKGSAAGPIVSGGLTGAADLAPDTYFLLVTDSEGCAAEFSFVVGQSSDPVYAVVPPINACTGNPVEIRPIHIAPDPTLPPASATDVRWYSNSGQTGLIQNGPHPTLSGVTYTIDDSDWLNPELKIDGLPAGTYEFYFYVVCTGQEIEIEVIVFDTPDVELEIDAIVCFGDTNGKVRVRSGSNPSYTYSLNGATPTSLTALESQNLATGTYSLVVATPAGCVQNLDFVIEGPSAPLSSSPLTKIDPGCGALNGKLILTVLGGWAPYSLEVFKNGVSIDNINTSNSVNTLDGYGIGEYRIEVRDLEGCVFSTNVVTLEDGPTQILIADEAICEGESAILIPVLDPVAPGSSFQWFLDQGLTQPITSSPNPAGDGRIYQINASTGALTISGLPASASTYSYYVTASGAAICPGFIGQGEINVGITPNATASVSKEVCFGGGATITVNSSGGSGVFTYSLNGGTFVNTNVFDVDPGTYSIEVRSQEGCSFTLDDIIVEGPQEALNFNSLEQDNASCGLDNGEIRFNVIGGYRPYSISYAKNGTNAGSITFPDGQVRMSNLGLGEYIFTITDAEGCEIILDNPLDITEVPTTITANDDQICVGEKAELVPSVSQNIPDPKFTWSFDAQGNNLISSGVVNGITYAIDTSGKLEITGLGASVSPYTYYVSATGTGICGLAPKPVTVTISPVANLRVSNPSIVCDPNGRVDLTDYIEGFNPAVYDYSVLSPSGAAMQINELGSVALSGDYRVSSAVKGTNCWNQPQRIRVLIAQTALIANFQYEIDLGGGNLVTNGYAQIEENVQFQDLTQGNAILWNWDFGDGSTSSEQNPVHQFLKKGTYTVLLSTIDDLGCQSEFQIIVNVFDDYLVMVPNAFTPDGSKNQFFKPQFRGIASMEFFIFNTWGELIYHTKSLEDLGWDGTLNGVSVPNGNYVYRGRFVSRNGEAIDKAGVFILIR